MFQKALILGGLELSSAIQIFISLLTGLKSLQWARGGKRYPFVCSSISVVGRGGQMILCFLTLKIPSCNCITSVVQSLANINQIADLITFSQIQTTRCDGGKKVYCRVTFIIYGLKWLSQKYIKC